MTWLHNANVLNKLRGRIYPPEPMRGFLFGLKFHFRGRFTRKQRAHSFVVERGNMPLTTLSANIDYGFVTMPLANSIVSIKI
jgi:ribosomal protein S3